MKLQKRLFFTLLILLTTGSAWAQTRCYSSWNHVQTVTVTNTSANALNDFQVGLDFDSQTLISAGKMNANGSDIRFSTDDCCTNLPVWIQQGINTANTKVWTRVPFIPAFGSIQLNMYYGNATAATVEHIDSVMFSIGNNDSGTVAQASDVTASTFEMTFPSSSLTVRWRLYSGGPADVVLKTSNSVNAVIASSMPYTLPQIPGFFEIDAELQAVQDGNPALYSSDSLRIMNSCSTPCPGVCGNGFSSTGDIPQFGSLGTATCGTYPSLKVWYRKYNITEPMVALQNDEFDFTQAFATTTNGNILACNGDSPQLSVNDIGALGYQWYNGSQVILGATDTTLVFSTAGNYYCIANFGGCRNLYSNATQATFVGPIVKLGEDTTVCTNTTYPLVAGPGQSYLWSTNATTQAINIATSGTYAVTVTDSIGCTASDAIAITVFPRPVASIVPSGPVNFCNGGDVELNAFGPTWLAYQWNVSGITSSSFTVSSQGTYQVIAYDIHNCADTSDAITVTVYPDPQLELGPDTVLCENETILIDAGPWPTILWSWGLTDQSYFVTFTGVYVVNIADTNGCEAVDSISVVFNEIPVIDLGTSTTVCPGVPVLLDAGPGYTIYDWSNNASSQAISPTVGTYNVVVTDSNGCVGTSNTVVIDNYPTLPQAVISGGAEGMTSSAGPNYQWYRNGAPIPGANAQAYLPDSSGDYYVMMTDSNLCGDRTSNTLSITVIFDLVAEDIPEGFSPNGDGINDNFRVRNLDMFQNNSLQVFNRWGMLVFERQPYDSDFLGVSDNGTALPDGTYFYILEVGNGQAPFSGPLTINR
jgi:gliding motility-associated-like protein